MKERKLTRYRLAKESGILDATIRGWLQDGSQPRNDLLVKVAEYFGVDPIGLLHGEARPTSGRRLPADVAAALGEIERATHRSEAARRAVKTLAPLFRAL